MLLRFSKELECNEEENCKNNLDLERCCKCVMMRRNMMDLMLRQELNSEGQLLTKSNSQKQLEILKNSKKDKKDKKNEEIFKNQNDIKYNIFNFSGLINKDNKETPKEKKSNKVFQENTIENIKDNINEKKDNEKIDDKENINLVKLKNDDKNQEEQINIKDNNILNKISDFNKNEIKFNDLDNNAQNISNNPLANFIGIRNNIPISPLNQLETFSIESENDNNLKNTQKKSTSVHSSSATRKNFILKTEIIKSEKQRDIHNKKNNYSDNPIINYYSGKHFSNFANFYMADMKSNELLDDNQYINFFQNKETQNESNEKDKDYINYSTIENKKNETIKEIDNIFEDDNLDEKTKLEKLNFINNDSIEKKFNLDFINNNSSSNIDDNSTNNIQIDNKNIINNKKKSFNVNNFQNDNFDNMINNNNFNFPLSKNQNTNQNLNNNNYINFDTNNNKFNNKNKFNNMTDTNNLNNINSTNNKNIFDFTTSNNNNNFVNIDNLNNLKEFKLDKDFFSGLSNLDLNKFNLNYPETNNYQLQNNYFIPIKNQNDNSNMAFKYIKYNNGLEINSNGLPSGKSFYEYSDDDILKYAIPLIKDQSGCRFLQERMNANKTFMENKLFPSIKKNLFELGCDAFGNYFLQALIDIFSYENLNLFLDLIKNDFKNMCINQHGTRVIQKVIDKVGSDKNFSSKLENILNTKELGIIIKSPYGNHIIQKYITSIHFKELNKFIYDYVLINFMNIAESKHGVCVIQKCVSEGDIIQRGKLYDLILQNFDELIKDEFGNYLIQYILLNIKSKEKFNEVSPLIKKIEDNLISICKFKFSANVIEKCLENGDNYLKQYLLECILNRYKENIIELLLDQYGIYIIQKAIKLNSFYRNKFYEIIKEKRAELNNIDLNDFKYRGAQKVLNSFKDLDLFSQYQNQINPDINNNYSGNYNNYNNYNPEFRNNYNNKRKNKRGRKNFRGK